MIHASNFLFYTMSSDSDDELVAACIIIAESTKTKSRKRKIWTKPWLKKRQTFGVCDTLLREFRLENEEDYFNFLRMSPDVFDSLYGLVKEELTKQNTVMREAIPPYLKLAATLRYLITGESFSSLQYTFRIHRTTIGLFVTDVCNSLYEKLKDTIQVRYILNIKLVLYI